MRRQARDAARPLERRRREDARAGDLTVEARQLVEIARALSYGARFIILDEPTAQLDGDEIKRLFGRMRELQRPGVTFLFISHHLQEVYEICQAVTVLRDARHIVTAPVAELPQDRLIEAMTGEQARLAVADAAGRHAARRRGGGARGRRALRRRLRERQLRRAARRGRRPVRRDQQRPDRRRRGDRGPAPATTAGAITDRRPRPAPGDVPAALALGVGCVPRSRHRQGLVLVAVGRGQRDHDRSAGKLGPLGFVAPRRKAALARRADRLARHRHRRARSSRCRASPAATSRRSSWAGRSRPIPSVLVLMDPTAGVDVKSKEALLAVVERMRRGGQGGPGGQRRARGPADLRPRAGHAPRRDRRRARGRLERQRARRVDRRNLRHG